MNTKIKLLIVFAILCGIVYRQSANDAIVVNNPVINPVVKPEPVPELDTNILFNDIDNATKLANVHSRKVLLIFGADWCPYCKVLKKDIGSLDTNKYIVCIIDTDKHSDLVGEFKIKGLPTSIILTANKQELSRKTGYKKEEYGSWLRNNHMDVQASWIEK